MSARATALADGGIAFRCPGCRDVHAVNSGWTWNGSLDKPTLEPSVLVRYDAGEKSTRCHSFVRDGRIEFLSDSTHELAGQTVDLPAWSAT